jgi:hypothetical protein
MQNDERRQSKCDQAAAKKAPQGSALLAILNRRRRESDDEKCALSIANFEGEPTVGKSFDL